MEDRNFGLFYKLQPGYTLTEQIKLALENFNRSPYGGGAGLIPVHAAFHPQDAPNAWEVEGLLIQTDTRVRPGYVRLCTCSFTQEFLEERKYIGRRISSEAASATSP